eukprot:354362-Chlamydomonas_euryale.AAC.2
MPCRDGRWGAGVDWVPAQPAEEVFGQGCRVRGVEQRCLDRGGGVCKRSGSHSKPDMVARQHPPYMQTDQPTT